LELTDSVTTIPLIGPKNAESLKRLNIHTVEDLLYHIPNRFEDFSAIVSISDLVASEKVTVCVRVEEIKNIFTKYRKRLTKAIVHDDTGKIEVIWFNQHYITKTIKKDYVINLSGKLGNFSGKPTFISPEYEILSREGEFPSEAKGIHTGTLVPIYPETYGISSKWLRSRINTVLKDKHFINQIDDFIPEVVLKNNHLIPLNEAINKIHTPNSSKEHQLATERFAFQELFLLQLRNGLRKKVWQERTTIKDLDIKSHRTKIREFIQSLPFKLTAAQEGAAEEILDDLEKGNPMNRLLEGDVGSGKTVVSAIACYASFLNGLKACYMAPTEILAFQVYNALKTFLEPFKLNLGLITASKKIEPKGVDLVVGTHALLFNKNSEFNNLGLVVIDEQHKFGVKQRAQLLNKSKPHSTPHLLTMTATPIPRSLALTLYGDLELSIIDELPQGRIPIKTFVVTKRKRKDCYQWIEKTINEHDHQVFIICPFIDESEHETLQNVKAAKTEFEAIKKEFSDFKVNLLHGRMKSKEKEKVVAEFKEGKSHILVSTPVVEVGIDIPNANIMIIEGAERYGLASLHQLRGRVGRRKKQAYCFLFTSADKKDNYRRLKALEKNHNGLELAKIDLDIRGPGEIFGFAQHGIPNLKVAKLTDTTLVKKAKKAGDEIIEQIDDYPLLKERIARMEIVEMTSSAN